MTITVELLAETIRNAAQQNTPLKIRGGGTKDFYGRMTPGDLLDTRGYSGIVDYEPTELYVTARCGTPLSQLERLLAERDQMLAFEPPHFGDATIGGVVAVGLSGPARSARGAVRDFVLGVRLIDGRGQELSFGGQVMKNVAGYDISRFIAGSLGTLALICEVSLKVLPIPRASATVALEASEADALRMVNQWAGQPLPISATCFADGGLYVRLSGAEAGLHAARSKLGGETLPDDRAFWVTVREQTHPFFPRGGDLWRISVPSVTPPLALGPTLIEWSGAQRWIAGDSDAARIREIAAKARGHATLFRTSGAREDAFTPLSPALAGIHRRLKREFDPHGIFNPGRMYADL